ncbi:hypothetical protein AaE_013758, partial [Aphanomyces astaci]
STAPADDSNNAIRTPQPARIVQRCAALSEDNDESDASSNEATPPPKKQKVNPHKRDKRSAGAVIGEAISKLVEVEASKVQQQNEPHQRVTQAIECLMENYSHLDGSDVATLADMMGQGFNATIFLALRGSSRDAWVSKNSN